MTTDIYGSRQKIFLIIAIACMVIAVGAITGGIVYTVISVNKTRSFVKADAVVTDIVAVRVSAERGGKKTLYSEIVQYEVGGKTYSAQNTSQSTAPQSKGSTMKIAYNPSNPAECVFVQTQIAVPVITLVLGAAFGVAGSFLLRYYLKGGI